MKILKTVLCAALLVAGLCGCEKNLIPEIDLANNLEGSWEKVYPEGGTGCGAGDMEFLEHQQGEPGSVYPDNIRI